MYSNHHYYLSKEKVRWDYQKEIDIDMTVPNYILYVVHSMDNTRGLVSHIMISQNRERLQNFEIDEHRYEYIQDVIVEELKEEDSYGR
jgi:hypothetical protein